MLLLTLNFILLLLLLTAVVLLFVPSYCTSVQGFMHFKKDQFSNPSPKEQDLRVASDPSLP